jgi:hypothetical protein
MMVVLTLSMVVPGAVAQEPIPDWPDHYDPFTLLTYNLTLTQDNWETIKHDLTFDIEVPALFWAGGEGYAPDEPILISVRRKSCDSYPLDDQGNPEKVSLKIDINEYFDDDTEACDGDYGFPGATCLDEWHDVKKLSLENGDDNNVVTEGFAYYLHQIAAESQLDYVASKTSWVKLYVELTDCHDELGAPVDCPEPFYNGIFVNVQQRDKTFLKNNLNPGTGDDLWEGDETWLYKYSDPYSPEIEEWPDDIYPDPVDSPNYEFLNFEPFQRKGTPPDDFVDVLNERINMEGLLTLAAVSAFHISPDDLISKGKNFFFVDYSDALMSDGDPNTDYRRQYFQWDLDSAFSGVDVEADIYDVGDLKFGVYEDFIIDNPVFNEWYTAIMQALLDGPFNEADLLAAVTAIEAEIGDALAADPHSNLGDAVPDWFDAFRGFLSARIANVQAQLPDPTSVDLLWFGATEEDKKGITLGWETANETDCAGFNIYRAGSMDGERVQINEELIPARIPGSPSGAVYGFTDESVKPKRTYYYWLEDVDMSGHVELHEDMVVEAWAWEEKAKHERPGR